MADFSTLERVSQTYDLRDPDHVTIACGGASIAVHLAQVGVNYNTADVDVLCPTEYFDALLENAPSLPNVTDVSTRTPCEFSRLRGNTSQSIDICPDPVRAPGILRWTASVGTNLHRFPLSYERCMQQDLVVRIGELLCMPLPETLLAKSAILRPKDEASLDFVVPLALRHGLITGEEYDAVVQQQFRAACTQGRTTCLSCGRA
jgi:hypothetical protein